MGKFISILALAILPGIIFIGISFFVPQPALGVLNNAGILFGYLLACITVALAVYAFLNRYRIRRWFSTEVNFSFGQLFTVPPNIVEAMIIPVSRREQPEWILNHLRPANVILLYTEERRQQAEDITGLYREQVNFLLSREDLQAGKFCLKAPFDPRASYDLAKIFIGMFLSMNIPPENIYIDATGGTAPMSIGLFLAGEEMNVSSIYIKGKHEGLVRHPKILTDAEPIFLSNRSAPPETL